MVQMAKRSYSCSGSSNGNNNADHLRRRATHGNGSASSSDGEDDHDSMRPRKLLKSNGLQLRNAENFISWAALIVQLTILCYICTEEVNLDGFTFTRGITISYFLAIYSSSLDCTRRLRLERFQQLLPRPEPSEEYCPLYTLVDDAGACRSFGFCFRTMKWVGLRHVPESTSTRSVTLPVASTGGLLFYTEDGHSSEDVLVVNPLTGEQKILGIPTLDNGAPALEEAQADGDDHENGDDSSEADAEDGSVVVSDESELEEVSDSGQSEGDEEEFADDEEEDDADGSIVSDESELDEVSDSGRSEGDEEESADDEEEDDDADNGHNSLQSRLIHVLQEPAAAAGHIATASFQLVMTGRALGSVEHPDLGAYEAEKSTEVYDFRTDTWTDSGDLCGNLRLAKNSSSAYYEGLILTVAYGPSAGQGLARAGNPYFLLSYNVASREWSVYTRIVIPGSSVDYEQPQILSCDGRIFLVTLYVCPTTAGAADEAPAAGAADGFSHQLVIHEFKARTLEFARVSREPFPYISPEQHRELPKCVGTSEGKICCGLAERALAYYDLREDKWTEYPEFEEEEDEEEIRYAGVCYKPSLSARVHW
ncbi:unnamed protein product [Sphagnum troendelagicum]|uniref:Uncharacterized protein n=1 Tax=Sphagnum troendelagicum TaxID=128251 RepID=A0ABP0UZG8_9BRYO